jgi:hypothetical protein
LLLAPVAPSGVLRRATTAAAAAAPEVVKVELGRGADSGRTVGDVRTGRATRVTEDGRGTAGAGPSADCDWVVVESVVDGSGGGTAATPGVAESCRRTAMSPGRRSLGILMTAVAISFRVFPVSFFIERSRGSATCNDVYLFKK